VLAGGVIGPVLLMLGLASTPASSASLLLNLESVLTDRLRGARRAAFWLPLRCRRPDRPRAPSRRGEQGAQHGAATCGVPCTPRTWNGRPWPVPMLPVRPASPCRQATIGTRPGRRTRWNSPARTRARLSSGRSPHRLGCKRVRDSRPAPACCLHARQYGTAGS
jgi:hypothetical protein